MENLCPDSLPNQPSVERLWLQNSAIQQGCFERAVLPKRMVSVKSVARVDKGKKIDVIQVGFFSFDSSAACRFVLEEYWPTLLWSLLLDLPISSYISSILISYPTFE